MSVRSSIGPSRLAMVSKSATDRRCADVEPPVAAEGRADVLGQGRQVNRDGVVLDDDRPGLEWAAPDSRSSRSCSWTSATVALVEPYVKVFQRTQHPVDPESRRDGVSRIGNQAAA